MNNKSLSNHSEIPKGSNYPEIPKGSRSLLVYNRWINNGRVYFGEHAKIMRLAFNIPDNLEIVVQL